MQNAKFCLLPQTAGTMLNTASHADGTSYRAESCQGSEYRPDPELWTRSFAVVHILLSQKEALTCTVWISVPVVL
jgi:hypothetical protein